jgi:hypothetical protein
MVARLSILRQAARSRLARRASSLPKLPQEVACKGCLGALHSWFSNIGFVNELGEVLNNAVIVDVESGPLREPRSAEPAESRKA